MSYTSFDDEQALADGAAGLAVLAILVVLGMALFLGKANVERRETWCGTKTVTSIGGCNHRGECGVVYSDGSRGVQHFPTIGGKCE